MKNKLYEFIEKLSKEKVNPLNVFNQYNEDDNFPQYFTTKMNLLLYLTQMKEKQPKTMLVGEAPGKDGCAITGIPFTSMQIISHENNFGLFGFPDEYKTELKKERTATMFWKILIDLNFCPLLWNSFPFNPFNPETKKNRKPTKEEVRIGGKYLKDLLEIFNIDKVVAIGNTANSMLNQLDINHYKVSHPSFGNKKAFCDGLKTLLDNGKIN